jgi:Holliday junction resolvasome RuvABC endonuclease subunit
MLVIGIDPGAAKTGVAWIRQEGRKISRAVYTIYSTERTPHRYFSFKRQLLMVLGQIPEPPVAVAIEEPDHRHRKHFEMADVISLGRLEAIYAIALSEVSGCWPEAILHSWKPIIWKGDGVSKEKTMARMGRKYKVSFGTDDESDALGIADHALQLMKSHFRWEGAKAILDPKPLDVPIKIVADEEEITIEETK